MREAFARKTPWAARALVVLLSAVLLLWTWHALLDAPGISRLAFGNLAGFAAAFQKILLVGG